LPAENRIFSAAATILVGAHAINKAHVTVSYSLTLTEQLRRYSDGDREMAEAILREVLPKLHQIAVRELRRERYVAPLDPTELINEVWIRNLSKGGWKINSRSHFYAIAALAMRRVLVDFARMRLAPSRGNGHAPISLTEYATRETGSGVGPEEVVQIGILMEKLEQVDPESARVVDMHHFLGLTLEEIADITSLTFRQVRHRWEKGRDWLKDRL
jgi:RNA polymerase sigma factor (TIGR02999 family)